MDDRDDHRDYHELLASYRPESNRTGRRMTVYERVKLVGMRAEQLVRGAKPTVPVDDPATFDPLTIARRELSDRTIPLMLRRRLPDGSTELWRVADMELSNENDHGVQ